mgnify:CR=1 FL=1
MEENQEKQKLQTILAQLTKDQLRLIVALQEHPSKDAAAKAIGVKVATVYNWDSELIDEAARLMALDAVQAAIDLRRRNLIKAAGVKVAGLDSKNELVRQKAATEIMEWELGKAQEHIDHTTNNKELPAPQIIEITKYYAKDDNNESA